MPKYSLPVRSSKRALIVVVAGLGLAAGPHASAVTGEGAPTSGEAYEDAGVRIRADLRASADLEALRGKLERVARHTVSGTFLDPSGSPAPGATVIAELQPTSALLGSLREGESAAVISLGRTRTDQSGAFSMRLPLDFRTLDGYINANGLSTVTFGSYGTDAVSSIDVSIPSSSARSETVATARRANEELGVNLATDGEVSLGSITLELESLPGGAGSKEDIYASPLSPVAPAASGIKCIAPAAGFGDASGFWEYTGSWRDRDAVVQTMHTGSKVKAQYTWVNARRTEFQLAGVKTAGGSEVKLGWDLAYSYGNSDTWTAGKNQRKDAAVVYRWRKYQLYCYMPVTWEKVKDARTKWIPYEQVGTNKFNSRQPQWSCNPVYRTRLATRSVVSRDRTTTASFSVGTKFTSSLSLGVRQTKTGSHKLTYDSGGSVGWLCGRGAPWPSAAEAKEVG